MEIPNAHINSAEMFLWFSFKITHYLESLRNLSNYIKGETLKNQKC